MDFLVICQKRPFPPSGYYGLYTELTDHYNDEIDALTLWLIPWQDLFIGLIGMCTQECHSKGIGGVVDLVALTFQIAFKIFFTSHRNHPHNTLMTAG